MFKELDQLVQLHESGEDFVQYIKSKKQFRMSYSRSNARLHIPQTEGLSSHVMDTLKAAAVATNHDDTLRERSLSQEKNRLKLSDKEEELYKLL